MRKLVLIPVLVVAGLVPLTPANASPAAAVDTNPVGSVRWLPANSNEASQVPAGLHRLVVVYDRSLTSGGKPGPLLTKGAFGLKISSTSPEIRMKGHSSFVDSVDDVGGDQFDPFDEAFAGVSGDVRDGACSKAGTPSFSAAFSTTRTFLHPGTTPYQAQSGPGACEVIDSSAPAGGGFQTRVTTFVPGFWVDVEWPTHDDELGSGGPGYLLADVWYSGVYDTQAEDGEFYETADAAGVSSSIGSPGSYALTFTASARPGGGIGAPCGNLPLVPPADPGTYQVIKVQVPAGVNTVKFHLFPHLDWDLFVTDPSGSTTGLSSGHGPGFDETVTAQAKPGEWTVTACNYAGEPNVLGAVVFS